MISVRVARFLINKAHEPVKYIQGEKTLCPWCKSVSPVVRTVDKKRGLRLHKCPACNLNFKSLEEKNINPSGLFPDSLDTKPKKRVKRKRKKNKK